MKEPAVIIKRETPAAALIFSPALIIAVLISAYGVLRMGIFPSAYIIMVKQSFLALL
jgi:hypothetical protein